MAPVDLHQLTTLRLALAALPMWTAFALARPLPCRDQPPAQGLMVQVLIVTLPSFSVANVGPKPA